MAVPSSALSRLAFMYDGITLARGTNDRMDEGMDPESIRLRSTTNNMAKITVEL